MKRLAHLMPHLPLEGWVLAFALVMCVLASGEAIARWPVAVVVVPALWGFGALAVVWRES